jgi:phage terminase large subunit-like protein
MRETIARRARAEQCKRSLYEFVKQGFHVNEPGEDLEHNWHLEAFCWHVQMMLEGWLVANGHGNQRMIERQKMFWDRHGLEFRARALLVQNLIINLPPATLKSRILMVCAPAWMWLHCPSWSVACISSVEDNVERDSDACRVLVTSDWYRETFEIKWKIKDGARPKRKSGQPPTPAQMKMDSVKRWGTTAGGERKSRTMMGNWTGGHTDALFLDDPDDAHKVHSEAKRREVHLKWKRAIKNRVKHYDRSIRIAIQQRVHVDDWTAAQVANGTWSPDDRKAWAWLVIPLLYGCGPNDAPSLSPWFWTDPRKVANENLQPSRFSEETIADEKREGIERFEGQYNQNPASYDDGMIKRGYVRFFRVQDMPPARRARPHGTGIDPLTGEEVPTYVLGKDLRTGELLLDWLTLTVDASNGSEALTASNVGLLVVGGKGEDRFIFDDLSAVMGIEQMYDAVAHAIETWPVKKVLIELKAAGTSVINDLKKRLKQRGLKGPDGAPANITIVPIIPLPGDSKEGRAAAMVSAWQNGFVYVLEGAAWLYPKIASSGKLIDEGFVAEVCTFPRSRKNDRVDAMSQLMTHYRAKGDAKSRWKALRKVG